MRFQKERGGVPRETPKDCPESTPDVFNEIFRCVLTHRRHFIMSSVEKCPDKIFHVKSRRGAALLPMLLHSSNLLFPELFFDIVRLSPPRSGKVVRIVREHYVRNDIFCQSRSCKSCAHTNPALPTASETNHYLVVDLETLVTYLELFEQPEFCNMVVAQTILTEARD